MYGILHAVCSLIGLDITKAMPYDEFLRLLFEAEDVLDGNDFDFIKVWDCVADYILGFVNDNPALKYFADLKNCINVDILWQTLNEYGISALMDVSKIAAIIDFKGIAETLAKNGVNIILTTGENVAEIVFGLAKFTLEWSKSIGHMFYSARNTIAIMKGAKGLDCGLTVFFYYNPDKYVQKHECQAYFNGKTTSDMFGTYSLYNLSEFRSPGDDNRTQKGILTFDRGYVWHVLLEYLGE